MNHERGQDSKSSNSVWKFVLIGFALVAAFFLITEHRAHVFGVLPYLLLAACPLLHFFGHGHGGHGGRSGGEREDEFRSNDKKPGPPGHSHH